ncbi:MAG: ATP-binding protein [Candidatus Lokiarchaeota archaeon]|nr:ATP-binding protein [Candidatus Lokiarchaeota archaeon]
MKITALRLKSPLDKYEGDIHFESLDLINVILGKNNSGKTRTLKQVFSTLSKECFEGYGDSSAMRKIELEISIKEFEELIVKYESKNPSSIETSTILDCLRQLLQEKAFSNVCDNNLIVRFEREDTNQPLVFNLEEKTFKNARLSSKIKFISEKVKKTVISPNDLFLTLKEGFKAILLPSTRSLESSRTIFESVQMSYTRDVLTDILENGFTSKSVPNADLKHFDHYLIPNFIVLLRLVLEGKIDLVERSFYQEFVGVLERIFPELLLEIETRDFTFIVEGNDTEMERVIEDWKRLGHGTQQIMSIMLLMMLPGDFLYFIDEPEIGLHPGLQTKFLQFVREVVVGDPRYSKQVFFSTHSTSFINFLENCAHFITRKEGKMFYIESLNRENLQLIRGELGLKPSDLLQANGVVWVEGPSDVFYVKMLFKCFDVDLDAIDVLIATYGSSGHLIANHFTLALMERLHPNFVVITDSDKEYERERINPALRRKKDEFEIAGHLVWIIDHYRDIEGTIPQDAISDFFRVRRKLSPEQYKKPYSRLKDYVTYLKQLGFVSPYRGYRKTRDAPQIARIVLRNPKYRESVKSNGYIKYNIERLSVEIFKWIKTIQ